MSHEPQIGAVFAERAKAELAVEDLRRSGLSDEHLGGAVVHQHGHPDDGGSTFERHEGRLVKKPEHIG